MDGVKRFQRRHGLAQDGIIGRSTHAALRIPIATRVRQIELALERLRWLPHLGEQRLVAINIPMFRLWAWDAIPPNGDPLFGMDVIVGRALRTQTPVFVEQLQELIFRPYWNVPSSIVRHEILPRLDRDPEYLRREQMEIVRGTRRRCAGRRGQRRRTWCGSGKEHFACASVRDRRMRWDWSSSCFPTQRTSTCTARRRRRSSAAAAATSVMAASAWRIRLRWRSGRSKSSPSWSRDRIVSAMNGTQSIHVLLPRPIQVVLFYTTAAVMPDDGTIHFAEDIYLHDALLDRALARRRSADVEAGVRRR